MPEEASERTMTTTTKDTKPRRERPESLTEARRWERYRSEFDALGLCGRCACQAAYGVQVGWSHVHPPCDRCRPVLAVFTRAGPNGWRIPTPTERRTAKASKKYVSAAGVPEHPATLATTLVALTERLSG